MKTYIAFLRGINVGGHHKVPMKELKALLEKHHYKKVITLLNSGNIILDADVASAEQLEHELTTLLERYFQFSIPTVVRSKEVFLAMLEDNPFQQVDVHKDIRLYVSFLYEKLDKNISLKEMEDESFTFIKTTDDELFSVLDLSKNKTTKAMEKMDKVFTKKLTTRNWNTIEKIGDKLI